MTDPMGQDEQREVIGSYTDETPALEAEYVDVHYFGQTIRVVSDPLSLELTLEEFLDFASSLEVDDMRAIGAVRAFLRSMIHPEDFAQFWRLVRVNRQDITKQMAFGKWLVEQMAGRPTEQPSGSESGRLGTVENSEADSSWRVQHRLEEGGRPDLATMVMLARERQEQSSPA